jgi:hypothetical protein
MNQVPREVVPVEFVQVEISKLVVADSVGKHVIDGHQDLMGHRYRRPLVSTPSLEAVKFVSQVVPLAFAAALAASTRAVFRYTFPLGIRLLLRLPGRFVIPRTESRPRGQL